MLGTDKALRRTWLVTLVMILALLANVTYVQGFQAGELRDDALNSRQYQNRNRVQRGPIVAGGVRLAWSEPAGDGRYVRRYRESETFAPVTGHFSLFTQTALENAENHILDGSDPRLVTTSLLDRVLGRKIPGGTVETTIRPDAQRAAYAVLRDSGARRGAVVALDAATGAIVAMASYPSYDANTVATLSSRDAERAFDRLNAAPRRPLLNKATGELFPPGSTFKTISAAAALAAGDDPSTRVRAGRSYRPAGAGQAINNDEGDIGGLCDRSAVPLLNAYAESCNTTFAYMGAEQPGNAALVTAARRYGFYERIEIERGMSAAPSSFPDTDQPSLSALGAIGQGSTVATPLQMALVAAASVNEGEVMSPYLVERLRGADGSTVERANPRPLTRALTRAQARQMNRMMREVVRTGTGERLQGSAVAGGKTGTADIDGVSYNDRWFIGFGPPDDPRYAVAVLTEADGYGIESGTGAARVLAALAD
ncbi:penicillin-binding transpeptidase domain-containing protein [Actinomadura flavalba]|uniref:penicillin-binding transpeptidase domain-containing protein n=1 Tax=Actinomadura flavalba TaxID=1120938 RepID=UPI00036238FB|nr:penicillin-binding transpeptidase domain-containing protein [Actinomadura flavalba]